MRQSINSLVDKSFMTSPWSGLTNALAAFIHMGISTKNGDKCTNSQRTLLHSYKWRYSYICVVSSTLPFALILSGLHFEIVRAFPQAAVQSCLHNKKYRIR